MSYLVVSLSPLSPVSLSSSFHASRSPASPSQRSVNYRLCDWAKHCLLMAGLHLLLHLLLFWTSRRGFFQSALAPSQRLIWEQICFLRVTWHFCNQVVRPSSSPNFSNASIWSFAKATFSTSLVIQSLVFLSSRELHFRAFRASCFLKPIPDHIH